MIYIQSLLFLFSLHYSGYSITPLTVLSLTQLLSSSDQICPCLSSWFTECLNGWMHCTRRTSLRIAPTMKMQRRMRRTYFAWTAASAFALIAGPCIASIVLFKFAAMFTMTLFDWKTLRNLLIVLMFRLTL
uniref:Uncharacterized protein n=1 Tax=Opuntia streptacantha TaxID=393608 RepID=A0A7C8ZJS5_OPUST